MFWDEAGKKRTNCTISFNQMRDADKRVFNGIKLLNNHPTSAQLLIIAFLIPTKWKTRKRKKCCAGATREERFRSHRRHRGVEWRSFAGDSCNLQIIASTGVSRVKNYSPHKSTTKRSHDCNGALPLLLVRLYFIGNLFT